VDFAAFLNSFLSGLAAGGVLLLVGYYAIDRALHLKARGERLQDAEDQRAKNVAAVLGVVLSELESNAAQLTTALTELPKGAVVYPLFDLTMWPIIEQATIFTALSEGTIRMLTHAYNRMRTSSEQNAFLSDLNHGSTAVLLSGLAALGIDDDRVKRQYQQFVEHRESVRNGLLDRLRDLKPFLDSAIDLVEGDLKLAVERAATERVYVPQTPPGVIGE
jgi:hypothetical protein